MESRDILSRLNTSVCLRERLAAILGAVGVAVTDQEIFDIGNQRNESLMRLRDVFDLHWVITCLS